MRVEIVDGTLTRELRRQVLRPALSIEDPLPGDELTEVTHFAALEPGPKILKTMDEVVSACFITPERCPWRSAGGKDWQLRQMATAAQHQGQGAGAAVLQAVLEHLATDRPGILWCYARESAVPLYERAGLAKFGEVFTDADHVIAHQRMWRAI